VEEKQFKPLIANSTLLAIYASMLRLRLFQDRVSQHLSRDERLPKQSRQQEAYLAGLLHGLKPTDVLVSSKEDLGAALLRNRFESSAISTVLAQALSDDRTSTRPVFATSKDCTIFRGAVAEMATFAAGVAFGLDSSRSSRKIVLAVLGAVKQQGNLDAALRVAAHSSLPLVLVCTTRGTRLTLDRNALHGVPHMPVDGYDAVAVHRVAQEAYGRTRAGIGSVLIECRLLPNLKDPLASMEDRLQGKKLFRQSEKEKLSHQSSEILETAFAALTASSLKYSKAGKR